MKGDECLKKYYNIVTLVKKLSLFFTLELYLRIFHLSSTLLKVYEDEQSESECHRRWLLYTTKALWILMAFATLKHSLDSDSLRSSSSSFINLDCIRVTWYYQSLNRNQLTLSVFLCFFLLIILNMGFYTLSRANARTFTICNTFIDKTQISE